MSPTSISGGGKLLLGGVLIFNASLKGQEEVLPVVKLEQWTYNQIAFITQRSIGQILPYDSYFEV